MSQCQTSLDALPQEIHFALAGFLPTAACAALAQTSWGLRVAYRMAHWQHSHVGCSSAMRAAQRGLPGRFGVPLRAVLFPHRYKSIFPSELVEVLHVDLVHLLYESVGYTNEYAPEDMSRKPGLDSIYIDALPVAAYPALRRIIVPIESEEELECTRSKFFQLMLRIDEGAQSHLLSLKASIMYYGGPRYDESSEDDQDNEDYYNTELKNDYDGEELAQEDDEDSHERAYIDHSEIEPEQVLVEYEEDGEGQNEEVNKEEIEETKETENPMESSDSDSESDEEVSSQSSVEIWDSLLPYIYHLNIDGDDWPFTLGSSELFANLTTVRIEMSHHESYSAHIVAHLNAMPQLATVFVNCVVNQTRGDEAKGLRVIKSFVTLAKLKSVQTLELTINYDQFLSSSYTILCAASTPKQPLAMTAVTHLHADIGYVDWKLMTRHFDFPTVRANGNAVAVFNKINNHGSVFLTAECLSYFSTVKVDIRFVDFDTVAKLAKLLRKTPGGIAIKRLEITYSSFDILNIELLFTHLLEGVTLEMPGAEIRTMVEGRFTKAALLAIAKNQPSFSSEIDSLLKYRSELCAAAINLVIAPEAYHERMIESLKTALEGRVYGTMSSLYCMELVYDFAMGLPALEYLYLDNLRMYGSPRLAGVLQNHPSLRQILVSHDESGEGSSTATTFPGFPPGTTVAYTCTPPCQRQQLLDVAQKRVFAHSAAGVSDISLDYDKLDSFRPHFKDFDFAAFAGWI